MANNPQAVIEVLGFYSQNLQSAPSLQSLALGRKGGSSDQLNMSSSNNSLSAKKVLQSPRIPHINSPGSKAIVVPPPPPLPSPKIVPKFKDEGSDMKTPEILKRRVSTMTDIQLMESLKNMVSKADPTLLFTKIRNVGQGASGSVYLAKNIVTDETVAIKEMIISRQPRLDMIINEINVMKEITHVNIVNFIDCFIVKDNLWVLMEYMEGGMLTDIIDKHGFTEQQIAAIALEVRILP